MSVPRLSVLYLAGLAVCGDAPSPPAPARLENAPLGFALAALPQG